MYWEERPDLDDVLVSIAVSRESLERLGVHEAMLFGIEMTSMGSLMVTWWDDGVVSDDTFEAYRLSILDRNAEAHGEWMDRNRLQ